MKTTDLVIYLRVKSTGGEAGIVQDMIQDAACMDDIVSIDVIPNPVDLIRKCLNKEQPDIELLRSLVK